MNSGDIALLLIVFINVTLMFITIKLAKKTKSKKESNFYLVDITYTKYPDKRFVRSQRHAGNKIANQYTQCVVQINDPMNFIKGVREHLEKNIPTCKNWRIENVRKIS